LHNSATALKPFARSMNPMPAPEQIIQPEERNAPQDVVMHKMESDDMASEHPSEKPAATGRARPDRRSIQPQQLQIPSPLSNDGLELPRDTHC
jgi:hypothetical protein